MRGCGDESDCIGTVVSLTMEPKLTGVDFRGNIVEHELSGVASQHEFVAVRHGDAVGDPEGALPGYLLPCHSI